MRASQIAHLKTKSTKFTPNFCKVCLLKYSSPELFHSCQNRLCKRVPVGEATLEPNLQLFEKH